jgi:hypothetical protein
MIVIPSSFEEFEGRHIQRIFNSYDLDQIVFDLERSEEYTQTRYAFEIDGTLERMVNFSNMVGYPVTEVRALGNEADGRAKMAIFTEGGTRVGIIYINPGAEEDSFITEGGDDLVQEDDSECDCLMLEQDVASIETELTEISVGKTPPFGSVVQYIVQEDDVVFVPVIDEECPCG